MAPAPARWPPSSRDQRSDHDLDHIQRRGNDLITLSKDGANVDTGRGNNTVEVLGAASVVGGSGFGRVVLSGVSNAYQRSISDAGVALVLGDDTVSARQVQYFDFAGAADDVLIVVDQTGAQLARFSDPLLGRVADYEGLAYWTDALEAGLDIAGIASSFAASSEFAAQGEELSASDFVVLHAERPCCGCATGALCNVDK